STGWSRRPKPSSACSRDAISASYSSAWTASSTAASPRCRVGPPPPSLAPWTARSVQVRVAGNRQELEVLGAQRHLLEDRARFLEAALGEPLPTEPLADFLQLVAFQHPHELRRHLWSLLQVHAVVHPLPDLRAGDLGRRRVLHQIEDRRRPHPAQ